MPRTFFERYPYVYIEFNGVLNFWNLQRKIFLNFSYHYNGKMRWARWRCRRRWSNYTAAFATCMTATSIPCNRVQRSVNIIMQLQIISSLRKIRHLMQSCCLHITSICWRWEIYPNVKTLALLFAIKNWIRSLGLNYNAKEELCSRH